MMICPGCRHDNMQGSSECEECGLDLAGLDLPEAQPQAGLRRRIMRDPIRRLGPLKPLVASPDTSIAECIRLMREGRHGSVLIVDGAAGERLVGIFTERDVLLKVWGSGLDIKATPVRSVMTSDPVVLREDDMLARAIHLMAVRGFRHIPVVREGRPVGFMSVRGILRHIAGQVLAAK